MEEKRLGLASFYQQQIVEELVMKKTVLQRLMHRSVRCMKKEN